MFIRGSCPRTYKKPMRAGIFSWIFLGFFALLTVVPPVLAQPYGPPQGRDAPRDGVQPLDRLLPGIRRQHPGDFYDAEGPTYGPSGDPHYHLKWMTPDGRVIWFDTDARNGRVVNANFAEYLNIMHVRGAGELAVFCGALLGASLGFLWFNAYPAQIFMGDVGSLALGSALGTVAVLAKHELLLLVIGGLFVIETLSVIIQVASFKLTGKRVFRMAPLHHHFEAKGWQEPKVIVRFWIIAITLALFSLSTLKLR